MQITEKAISERLYHNSIVFLKDAIQRLLNIDAEINTKENSSDNLILICNSLYKSVHLATTALVIKNQGLQFIINEKDQTLAADEIKQRFYENDIKTLDFKVLREYVQSLNLLEELSLKDFKIIDDFKIFFNKILHYSEPVKDDKEKESQNDLIFALIHVVFKIQISNKKGAKLSKFLKKSLGGKLHEKLIKHRPYVIAMQRLAEINSKKVLTCIDCENRTYSQDEAYCYCCNFSGEFYNLLECDTCNEKRAVMYDNLNIEHKNFIASGHCLNCGAESIIFHCPTCGFAYNIETKPEGFCTSGHCVNE